MGTQLDTVTLVLLAANVVASFYAFNNPSFFQKYSFKVGRILYQKEYIRMISSGFLHVGPGHLIMNMLSLYFCGPSLNIVFGPVGYLLIYFGSMIGGDLLALFIHRKNPDYSAVGASGAISGIIFAFVYFAPYAGFLLFFVIPCPAWLLAILFTGYSLFGIKTQQGNIGHEAHLGGALLGMFIAILLIPELMLINWWIVLIVVVPTALALLLLVYRPDVIGQISKRNFKFGKRTAGNRGGPRTVYKSKGLEKAYFADEQEEMDHLLDIVAVKGYGRLSELQKKRLDQLSGRLRNRESGRDSDNQPL